MSFLPEECFWPISLNQHIRVDRQNNLGKRDFIWVICLGSLISSFFLSVTQPESPLGMSFLMLCEIFNVLISFICLFLAIPCSIWGFPSGSDSKEFACNAGDRDLIPGSGRALGEGNGYPLQYFCLENPMDRGTWWATVLGIAKSWTWPSD